MKTKILLAFLISLALLPNVSNAQLFTFNFGSTNTTTCVTDGNTPPIVANATITAFTRTGFPSFTCDSYIGYLNTKGFNQGVAIDSNQYLQVTLTANTGYKLNIASASFSVSKSSTGPVSARIAHNASGNFSNVYKSFTPGTSAATINWNDFTSFTTTSGGSVSFRIYGWGATSTVGTMRMGSFAVFGAVTQAPVAQVYTLSDSIAMSGISLRELPLVIRTKDTLGLTTVQINKLIKASDSIKKIAADFYALTPNAKFNTRLMENSSIRSILTTTQYIMLLNKKSKRWSDGSPMGNSVLDQPIPYAIDEKDTLGLTTTQVNNLLLAFDSTQRAEDIFKATNVNPAIKFDRYSPQYNALLGVLSTAQYNMFREIKYKENFKAPFTTQFALAKIYKDTLGLSATQITAINLAADTLKNATADSARLRTAIRFDGRAFESSRMTNILTSSQYTLLLVLKNKAKAKVFALNDWKELEQRGLTTGHDKDSTISQLTNFYILRESAYNRYQHDRIMQSEVIQYLYASKPPALNALIHARRNPDNNTQGQYYQW